MTGKSKPVLFRDDLRQAGVLLFVAGIVGALIEPMTLHAAAVAVLGLALWGSAFLVKAEA